MKNISLTHLWTLTLILPVFIFGTPTEAQSQGQVSFTPYAGYRLGGSLNVREGELQLSDAPFFGGQLESRVRSDATVALLVDYQPSELGLSEGSGPNEFLFDMNVWYAQLGGTLEAPGRSASDPKPYALGTLGITIFDPSAQDYDSEYAFSGIFGAGVKVPVGSGGVGLRLQARVLLNFLPWGGSTLWCGGGTCYAGAGGTLGPAQFDFGGGLTLGGR